ncbi:hypothetical protein [Zoogloea sp.]|uniref:hypothetical protein n=1 Tax=Zoogloea sp. TaxID=49181 RepID=UPI00262A1902|nr:hypothetical protein [Zoogloea sp.]MDD3354623.1 hypothetical protein [Zoogloea sp.]
MQKDWIPAKTPAGVEEIEGRSRRLPLRLRTVLILADGRRSVDQLCTELGVAVESIQTLHDMGLVAPRYALHPAGRSREAASRASMPPEARAGSPERVGHVRPEPQARRSLALARLYLIDAMAQTLRKGDEPVRQHLRQATTRAELLAAFELCREIAIEAGVTHLAAIEARFLGMLPVEE